MYIVNFLKEINIWRKVRRVAKENEKALNEAGFRVDWVGRIYTVINLPEEVITQPISREGYVLMKLREYDSLFLNMGIADYISPEIVELIDGDAYLLVLSPDRDYVKLKSFLWFSLKSLVLFIIIRILWRITVSYWDSISSSLSWLVNLIF
jgi:hypothetical protein